jgi:hypothetical protein
LAFDSVQRTTKHIMAWPRGMKRSKGSASWQPDGEVAAKGQIDEGGIRQVLPQSLVGVWR